VTVPTKRTSEADESVNDCFCLQSRMTARAITRQYNAALAPVGLEITEFSLLAALATIKGESIADLAEQLAFERTTLVRNLKRLEERGLVRQTRTGGRAVWYALTRDGLALQRRAAPLWRRAQAAVRQALAKGSGGGGGGGKADAVLRSLEALRHAAGAHS
jgi:DNA-binding MarR family transcriptional regulator